MTNYDDFKENLDKAKVIEESARGVLSDNPRKVSFSRSNLVSLINSVSGPKTVSDTTSTSAVLEHVPGVEKYFGSIGVGRFRRDTEEIIGAARIEHGDKFIKRYLSVTPILIDGDVDHNAVAGAHSLHYGLSKAVESHDNGKSEDSDRIQLIGSTAELMEQNIALRLSDPDASEEAINNIIGLVINRFEAHPETAYAKVRYAVKETKDRVDGMLGENQRAAYLAKSMQARADLGGDNVEIAAKELYEVIAQA